ncbi:phosphotransferase [Puniceibacterium confluentis]|uniref:phosphotransferase n=2 Tax=Puniceibacterium confluentis TaxID=1958944 RepID=UPI0011B45661|nr:phosphotransferase [Puniceibacterium confluentis]
MAENDLLRAALDCWPPLAAQAGIAPEGWTVDVLARRQDSRVQRLLLRLSRDGKTLVLKHEAAPLRPEDFGRAMQEHMLAMQSVSGSAGQGVPELLAFDSALQSCLMTHVAGRTLRQCLEDTSAPQTVAALLTRAGAWVAAFHRGQIGAPRTFQPRFTEQYLRQVMSEVRDQSRRVAEPEFFLSCAERLCALAHRYEGQQTVTAKTHGDLHLSNLLIGTRNVWGIDFAGGRTVPVGHDLARLLVDYATGFALRDDIAPGEVLPEAAEQAFFRGYDLVGPGDPSVQMLLRNRVLADWWGIPDREEHRTVAQARRLHGLLSLARRTFAETT